MRNKLLRGLIALLAGVTLGLVISPGTSYASTGFTTTGGGYVAFGSAFETNVLPSDWRVGDCTMIGKPTPTGTPQDGRTYARLTQPDGAGNGNVYIFEATKTANSPTDVWWTTLRFYTAYGTLILTTPSIPGAQMTTTNHMYIYDAWTPVTLDPQLYPLVSYVTWSVSC